MTEEIEHYPGCNLDGCEHRDNPYIEPCDCSEDYGPCELHSKVWSVREGASTRTADELALCLVDDLLAISEETSGRVGSELSPWGREVVDKARAALSASDLDRGNWLDDPDLEDSLFEVADQVEASSGLWVTHEDGYVIHEVTGGPLS